MNGVLTVALTAGGVLLAGAALRDVFHTLWHPSGEGPLSRWASRTVWRTTSRHGSAVLDVAGPLVMAVVILTWAGLVMLGFALVYLPWLSGSGFVYGSGLDPAARAAPLDALYLSSVVLSTLGFGDIVPSDGWLRLVTAAEALIGFTLLTAGISWITQIQQALVRRRSAARFLVALQRADHDSDPVEPTRALLEQVARDLAGIQVDLWQSTMSYYFRERDPHGSLAVALPWAAELSRRGHRSSDAEPRRGAVVLDVVIDDLLAMLRSRFLTVDEPGREPVMRAYLADHQHDAR